ncbi:MAG: hypothetical protein WKG01_11470 [Kofleriaceae bacterium]
MAGALDERGCLIDRVREQDLLTARVVVQATATIAHEVANHERHLDRIATEPGLISTEDDVPAHGIGEQVAQASTGEKVVARTAVIDVVLARLVREPHAIDRFGTTAGLDVEAELLLAFVVLRTSAVGSDSHRSILVSVNASTSARRRNHPARRGFSQ